MTHPDAQPPAVLFCPRCGHEAHDERADPRCPEIAAANWGPDGPDPDYCGCVDVDALWIRVQRAEAAAPSLLQERDRLTPHERRTLARHQEDGNGGCIVCREWDGTFDEDEQMVSIMAWPCPVVRLARLGAASSTEETPPD